MTWHCVCFNPQTLEFFVGGSNTHFSREDAKREAKERMGAYYEIYPFEQGKDYDREVAPQLASFLLEIGVVRGKIPEVIKLIRDKIET